MARYKSIAIVAAVLTFGYALGHFTTTAMLSGEANSLLFLRNTVGLVVGSGILWASMSVWAGRVAGPRLWRSILAGTVIIFAMLAIHYAFGLLIGVFDDQIFSSNALWMYGSFISGPTFGLIGGLSHKFPWLLLIVPLGLIAEPFVINSIPGTGFLPWPTVWAGWVSGAVLISLGIALALYLWKVVFQPQTSSSNDRTSNEMSTE